MTGANKTQLATWLIVVLVLVTVVVIYRHPSQLHDVLRLPTTVFNQSVNTSLLQHTVQQRDELSRQLNLLQVYREYNIQIGNQVKRDS